VSNVNQEFSVGPSGGLSIKIQSGRVDVIEGRPGVIGLEVTTKDVDAVELHQSGDTVYVTDNRSGWVVRGNIRIVASVPPGSDLEVSSASADIHIDVELREVICRTASGDVSFRSADSIEVKTASGAVRGERVDGDVRVNSASGDIMIDQIGGRLTAALASGDVRVDKVGGDVRANSASGDVRIDRFLGDEVTIKSVSGDLVIGFPKGITLEAEVNTLSGNIHIPDKASGSSETGGPGPRRRVRLSGKTVSGDIRISTFSG
jgi:DUF4097 and DUF4098 domain-containing protein YvlB